MRYVFCLSLLALLLAVMSGPRTFSAPPTDEAVKQFVEEGRWEKIVDDWLAFKAAGGSSPEKRTPLDKVERMRRLASGEKVVDTIRVITILVDFPDYGYDEGSVAGEAYQFDSILFSNRETDAIYNPTGSMTDYYLENSYGTFLIQGDIFGWYTMPQTYEYYVGDDNGLNHGHECARDAAIAAKEIGGADYSNYDSNGDGVCDGLIIVHAGPGAETGAYGIWSHKSNLSPSLYYDGVELSPYNINPEEYRNGLSPIGVVCHEFGHYIGLPDLYDVDYDPSTSNGMGDWALMAGGSYNGDSRIPAQMVAWCKAQVGFLTPVEITENTSQTEFPCVEYNPVAYILRNSAAGPGEYWMVENRQKVGFDLGIPFPGLCIYHIDENGPWVNIDHLRYLVAMEQADGRDDLAFTQGNDGDAGDPWPGGSGKRNFHDRSIPDSKSNLTGETAGITTQIGVWNISDSDSLMYADLDIEWSRPWVELDPATPYSFSDVMGGDGDGILEPGETVHFYCTAANHMRTAYNAWATLSTSNPDISFTLSSVSLTGTFTETPISLWQPIEFSIAADAQPIIDSFFLEIVCDSLPGSSGSGEFSFTFPIEKHLGAPQVLVVDDDRGEDYETYYTEKVYDKRLPFAVWEVDDQGVPASSDLLEYPMVFWTTGDSTSGAAIDPGFLTNYLGLQPTGHLLWPRFSGVDGNALSDGTQYLYQAGAPAFQMQLVEPVGTGEAAFTLWGRTEVVGITRQGSSRTVFTSFPYEYLDDERVGWNNRQTFVDRVMDFLGGESGPCCAGIRGNVDGDAAESIDISDIVYIASWMFQDGPFPPCLEEADVTVDSEVDISDLVFLVSYAFNGGPAPSDCP